MIAFDYLYKGLCGMARAHLANNMTGHLGAAVVAGYFCGEDMPDLDGTVYAGIEGELNRIIQGEEKWFDPQKVGLTARQLFEPLPDESPQAEAIVTIADALSENMDGFHESGHNAIFASIALRALRDHSALATPAVIEGIRQLIAGFNSSGPGRGYYGEERGWILGHDVVLAEENDFPPYDDQVAMTHVVMDELIASASMHRQGFGGLWHVINHAAAITELSRYGFGELAQRGLAAHHEHVRLWRSLPDLTDELGPMQKAEHDPRTPEYWTSGDLKRDSALLTHRVKTMYGFQTLARLVSDSSKLEQAEDKFRYLM